MLNNKLNKSWKFEASSSFSNPRKKIDHDKVLESQCSITKPLGSLATLYKQGNLVIKGSMPHQMSFQKDILPPEPSLKLAKESTCLQTLEIFIQGLQRLSPNFQEVCQLNWSLCSVFFHCYSFLFAVLCRFFVIDIIVFCYVLSLVEFVSLNFSHFLFVQ